MGSVKRRGGSSSSGGTGGSSSRSKSSSRTKEKSSKNDDTRGDDMNMSKSSRNRNRIGRRAGSASPTPDSSRRRRIIDPTVLARGMSSRAVGARVSQQLSILNGDEIERDLRHMEAYANACTTYAQQFFIFHNRALVNSGHFGPVSGPGLAQEHYLANGTSDGFGHQGYHGGGYEGGQYGVQNRQGGRGGNFLMRDGRGASQFAMPVRIDPEEEKRVAILRKRIAASEAQREELETEYMSLRAHYVHESHKLRRKRHSMDGELKMLQDLIKRRGEVLALRRVRCAVARDILQCLERRTQFLKGDEDAVDVNQNNTTDDGGELQDMEGIQLTDNKEKESKSQENEKELADVLDVWNDIEGRLRSAEQACTNMDIPEDLSKVKSSDFTSAKSLNSGVAASRKREDSSTTGGGGPKKKVRRGSDDSGKKSTNDKETGGKRNKNTDSNENENVDNVEDDSIVPWESQIMPRTPYGVPVYMSYLSSVADRTAGFGGSSLLGSSKSSLCWLEPNVPDTFVTLGSEREELLRLREETQFLERELNKERHSNKELQQQIIIGRKRSDEMCSMMSILRCETEAVLNRHNVLLDTPEARSAAQAIHSQAAEEREQPADEYDEDELEEQDVGELEDVAQADEVRPRASREVGHEEEGEVHEDDDVDDEEGDQASLSAKEEKSSNTEGKVGKIAVDDNDNDGDDEGGIDEDEEEDGEILEGKPPNEVILRGDDQDSRL